MDDQASEPDERGFSFKVKYPPEEVAKLASEVLDNTIAEVHLSLFTYWICQSDENYDQAKAHIRELGLCQDYPLGRVSNPSLRQLLETTQELRPEYKGHEDQVAEPFSSHVQNEIESPPETPPHISYPSYGKSVLPLTASPTLEVFNENEPSPFATAPKAAPIDAVPQRRSSAPASSSTFLVRSNAANTRDATAAISPATHDFPPPTPDRPAPLNIRSSASSQASARVTPAIHRSASTPVRSTQVSHSGSSPTMSRAPRQAIASSPSASPLNQMYSYTTTTISSHSGVFISGPAPTPAQRGVAAQARREAQMQNACQANANMPLPLRHYDSDSDNTSTTIQPDAGQSVSTIQPSPNHPDFTSTTHFRARSAPARSLSQAVRRITRPPGNMNILRTHTMRASPGPLSIRALFSLTSASNTVASSGLAASAPAPRVPSPTTPNPSVSSPFASAPSPFVQVPTAPVPIVPAPSTSASYTTNPLNPTWRSMTEAYITSLLQQTRARGAQLDPIDPSTLSVVDRTWRDVNAQWIFAILGRSDIELTQIDVNMVDRISKQFGEGVLGHNPNYSWVRELFFARSQSDEFWV
ncbi:hypothetical protein K469DRAFT_753397 [Zopfia rhizophila CBS 207.26]|uniref:Uncharacterized protein n=1 Tax=Zopfia rhizophila CBS 207.26 TaxID=1314779 RepID=A0A6A6DN26_9PEZI|nr:hypothetical protein K469DRAFT_753397 [Zopfia rhizophila CBS 207.26]